MRIFKSLALVLLAFAPAVFAADPPAAAAPGDSPKGEVTKHTFDQSKIFPGTTRDYWVYVPRQYDGSKPACLFVDQDNIQFKAPQVFDQLIASKEMPVTIGIFVQPGVVKAPTPDALDRFNRSYEYDGLGDSYVRFLLEELIPHIVDEQKLKISSDGNDRAIAGSSSGAVCAFTAAWERPDSFRRVFSSIGTYVGLRGANVYPTLIRKTEPKPLRIFLQDGSNDLNIYGGDWWMANNEMERALTFAGYEVNHAWGEGKHESKQATEVFPDAMRWLWKDWPAPIKAGAGSEQLQKIVLPGESWTVAGEGYQAAIGLASNAKGEVFFNDPPDHKTLKVGVDGKIATFIAESENNTGQAFGADDKLYAITVLGRLLAFSPEGKSELVGFDAAAGRAIVVRNDGSMYMTGTNGIVWRWSATRRRREEDKEFGAGAGIALSPDQSLLYVADGGSHWVYSYQIQPDGSLADKQRYFHLHSPDDADDAGAQGMCVDRDGRLYVATRMGVQVCDQPGRVNCILPLPSGRVTSVCLGGENGDTLFATCGDKVFKRKLKVKGAQAFGAAIKPEKPHL